MTSEPFRLTHGPFVPAPTWPGRSILLRIAVVSILSGLVVVFHRPILVSYARLFRVDDAGPSDAIVMLLGGPGCRPAEAASRFRAGLAPRIVLAGGPTPAPGILSESIASARIMVALGVPARAISIVSAPVMSTKDEAEAILPIAVKEKWARITVVTSGYHTARARWIFRRVFRGTGIEIRTAAAVEPTFDETNWFEKDESVIIYFFETIKTILYRLRY